MRIIEENPHKRVPSSKDRGASSKGEGLKGSKSTWALFPAAGGRCFPPDLTLSVSFELVEGTRENDENKSRKKLGLVQEKRKKKEEKETK